MQFNLHPEVCLYVFTGASPNTAQLVGISQHGGEVNLKLGMLHQGMKLYLGGPNITHSRDFFIYFSPLLTDTHT